MGLFLTWTAGLIIWIVLWALGGKGFDAFMIAVVLLVLGVIMNIVTRRLPGRSGAPQPPDDPAPFN